MWNKKFHESKALCNMPSPVKDKLACTIFIRTLKINKRWHHLLLKRIIPTDWSEKSSNLWQCVVLSDLSHCQLLRFKQKPSSSRKVVKSLSHVLIVQLGCIKSYRGNVYFEVIPFYHNLNLNVRNRKIFNFGHSSRNTLQYYIAWTIKQVFKVKIVIYFPFLFYCLVVYFQAYWLTV